MLAVLGVVLAGQAANAATIEYTYSADLAFSLDGTNYSESVVISGLGDTDNRFAIDGTRVANAFAGTFAFGGNEVSFTETVYATRAGGTLSLTADIIGTVINTVVSGNVVPITYDLVSDASFSLAPAVTFGSFDTDAGLLEIFSFRADSTIEFRSELVDDTAAVPLPASLPMLLAGLALIGGAGVRQTRNRA